MDSSIESRRPIRWVLAPLLLIAALVATVIGVSFYFNAASPQAYGWWPWAPFGWFFFIPLFFVAFFALRFFWWGPWGGRGWYYHEVSAMQVLRERFARGEITREQFEQMRKDLEQE
jgi:putative membrane protein